MKSSYHKYEVGSQHWYFHKPRNANKPSQWTWVVVSKLIWTKHEGRYSPEIKVHMPDYIIESLDGVISYPISVCERELLTPEEAELARAVRGIS